MNTPSFLKSMLETGEKQLDFIDQAEMEKERARRVPIREGILNAFPEDFREYVQIKFKGIEKEKKISVNLVFEGIAPVLVRMTLSSQGRYEIGWSGYTTYGVPAVGKKSGDWQHGNGLTRWVRFAGTGSGPGAPPVDGSSRRIRSGAGLHRS